MRVASSPYAEVFVEFFRLGCLAFGGPIAHIAHFQRRLIRDKKWLSDDQYTELVALCQFLPGPASSQVGFALGYYRAGLLGALIAFISFTLPSVFLLLSFATIIDYIPLSARTITLHALKLGAVLVVFQALQGMWLSIASNPKSKSIALITFVCLLLLSANKLYLLVLLASAIAGMALFSSSDKANSDLVLAYPLSKRVGICCLFLFFGILLMALSLPASDLDKQLTISRIFAGFYQAGALVFGGGHVVLPMLQHTVVDTFYLDESTFISAYGAAQAIPGPLFSVAALLGYELSTVHSPLLIGAVCLLAIFLPGFLLLLGVLPFWQSLQTFQPVRHAIKGLNAGVLGLLAASLLNPIMLNAVLTLGDLGFVCVMIVLLLFKHVPLWFLLLSAFIWSGASMIFLPSVL